MAEVEGLWPQVRAEQMVVVVQHSSDVSQEVVAACALRLKR